MALHALLYCERLFYLEEVEEIRIADHAVYAGRRLHDEATNADDETPERRSWELQSNTWGIFGKVDAVRRAGLSPTGQPADLDNAGATALARRVPYSAHSLRAGFVTYAAKRGATSLQIARQTRHKDLASIGIYTRIEDAWEENAATQLPL